MLRGGGGRLLENSPNNVFFFFFINLFYSLQRGSNCLSIVLFQRELLFQVFRGGPSFFQGVHHFPGGGGPAFSRVGGGDPNAIFNRNPYNFQGGGGPLSLPLDPHIN